MGNIFSIRNRYQQLEGMFKKVRCLTHATQVRQDAPFHRQGRSPFEAQSILIVSEHGKRATCLREAASAGMEPLAC